MYRFSFKFDSSTRQCFVSDESSDMAVSSRNLDLYEPFCSQTTDTSSICDKPYAYEKMITSRLVNAAILQGLQNQTVESCLNACMSSRKRCRAVNYDVNLSNCYLMSTDKTDMEATVVQDESYDYYEPTCLQETQGTSTTAPSPTNSADIFLLREKNRTLRQEFRNIQHWEIDDLDTCWFVC
ncbi:hypothetical protein GCK32_014954 [Trichostrongylus colubriformis]|uniref:Apple domain-containing protein n=1 Tax=Trichostrongylus colubriformis TaxID=6319 RepID=A0AAN8IUT4_TRICO